MSRVPQSDAMRAALAWIAEPKCPAAQRGRRAVAFVLHMSGPSLFGARTDEQVAATAGISVRTLRYLQAELRDSIGLHRMWCGENTPERFAPDTPPHLIDGQWDESTDEPSDCTLE